MNRTDRLYALVEELRAAAPGYRSTTWLAERFEVSSRTVERDLSALQQAGVPIFATPGRRGGYAIDAQHTLPPLNLTAAEVAAVATALAVDSSTPFSHAGRSALQKILAVLSEVDTDGTQELAARIRLFDTRPRTPRPPAVVEHSIIQRRVLEIDYVDKQDQPTVRVVEPVAVLSEVDTDGTQELAARIRLFDTRPRTPRPPAVVEHSIIQRRVLEIDYVDKQDQPTVRVVEPVAVLGVHPNWYLWGWCRLRDAPRSFRLDRIRGAVMSEERAPDRGMDPTQLEITELVGRGILGR